MSQADDRASLLDVLKAARLVTAFVEGMDAAGFSRDPKAASAVDYQLMVAGEAVKRLSEAALAWHARLPEGPVEPEAGRNEYPWPKAAAPVTR